MQLRVALRVDRRLEQRHEDVLQHRLEVAYDPLVAVDVVQAGDLHQPHDVVGAEAVGDDPRGEDVPLDGLAAVDGDAQLGVLVPLVLYCYCIVDWFCIVLYC